MANLTIRNVDDEAVETLKRRAKLGNRSLEAELREIILAASRRSNAELLAEAKRIAALTADRKHSDSTLLVREDRDR